LSGKTFVLISIPDDFYDKLIGVISNVNTLNSDKKTPPIRIEDVYKDGDYAAVPKKGSGK